MKVITFAQLLFILILGLVACNPMNTGVVVELETPVPIISATPTAVPLPTPMLVVAETETPSLSLPTAVYRDERAGFEFDYPADWTAQLNSTVGSRGTQSLLLPPGTTQDTLTAGTLHIAVTIYQWEPNDLAAYAAHRQGAWLGSGSKITSEAVWELADGRTVMSFVLQGPDNVQAFILLTTVGEEYLQLSGEGDIALVEEVARTLRPLGR
jgi:hypothetical protein